MVILATFIIKTERSNLVRTARIDRLFECDDSTPKDAAKYKVEKLIQEEYADRQPSKINIVFSTKLC